MKKPNILARFILNIWYTLSDNNLIRVICFTVRPEYSPLIIIQIIIATYFMFFLQLIETLEGHFVTTVIAKQVRANQPVRLKANDDKWWSDIPFESNLDNSTNVVDLSFNLTGMPGQLFCSVTFPLTFGRFFEKSKNLN
jgi:hypothetical protein